ncbi:MAG: hypothetical protein ABW217_17590 [Polyangiaceae bacterium]
MVRVAVWVLIGGGVLGCDLDEPQRIAPTPATTSSASALPAAATASAPLSSTSPAPTSAPSAPARPRTSGIVEQKRDGMPSVLDAVRAAKNDGYDRVVFEFRERVPGYHLEYVAEPVLDCGAGDVKPVEGKARLEARFFPANAHTEQGQPTVAERELKPALPIVRELERTCDFEAVVTWVIGTTSKNPYSVLELADPPRLVIDIEH